MSIKEDVTKNVVDILSSKGSKVEDIIEDLRKKHLFPAAVKYLCDHKDHLLNNQIIKAYADELDKLGKHEEAFMWYKSLGDKRIIFNAALKANRCQIASKLFEEIDWQGEEKEVCRQNLTKQLSKDNKLVEAFELYKNDLNKDAVMTLLSESSNLFYWQLFARDKLGKEFVNDNFLPELVKVYTNLKYNVDSLEGDYISTFKRLQESRKRKEKYLEMKHAYELNKRRNQSYGLRSQKYHNFNTDSVTKELENLSITDSGDFSNQHGCKILGNFESNIKTYSMTNELLNEEKTQTVSIYNMESLPTQKHESDNLLPLTSCLQDDEPEDVDNQILTADHEHLRKLHTLMSQTFELQSKVIDVTLSLTCFDGYDYKCRKLYNTLYKLQCKMIQNKLEIWPKNLNNTVPAEDFGLDAARINIDKLEWKYRLPPTNMDVSWAKGQLL